MYSLQRVQQLTPNLIIVVFFLGNSVDTLTPRRTLLRWAASETPMNAKTIVLLTILAVAFFGTIGYLTWKKLMKFYPVANHIASESKNPACGAQINEALRSIAEEMGLGYTVERDDYKHIFDSGSMRKGYHRQGIQYFSHFTLIKTQDGCDLRYFKEEQLVPQHEREVLTDARRTLGKCLCVD